jgi:hypothetical protein
MAQWMLLLLLLLPTSKSCCHARGPEMALSRSSRSSTKRRSALLRPSCQHQHSAVTQLAAPAGGQPAWTSPGRKPQQWPPPPLLPLLLLLRLVVAWRARTLQHLAHCQPLPQAASLMQQLALQVVPR